MADEKTEVGSQKSEVKGQKSEVGSQRSEVKGQKSEVGSQRSEVKGQKSEVGSQPATQGYAGPRKSEAESKKEAPGLKLVKQATSNKQPAASNELRPVEELAVAKNIKPWEFAGLMRAAGWAPGKQVTKEDFDQTLDRFRKRPQGGGKL